MTPLRTITMGAAALVSVMSVCEPVALAQDSAPAVAPATSPAPVSASAPSAVLPMPADLECRLALVALESARADIDAANAALAEMGERWHPLVWFGIGALATGAAVVIVKETGVR